jgi:hypothetical protein
MPLLLNETYAISLAGKVIGVFLFIIYLPFFPLAWKIKNTTVRIIVIIIMLIIGKGAVNLFF